MGHLPFFFIIAAFINPLAILIYAAILICITLKHRKEKICTVLGRSITPHPN